MNTKITKRILYGNIAVPLKKQVNNNTHSWTLFVQPCDENDVELFNIIDFVTFHLHESFVSPHRKISQPPFEITEQGWGEFDALIEIVFKHDLGSITLKHFIMLFNQERTRKGAMSHVCYDQFIFVSPTAEISRLLTTKVIPTPSLRITQHHNMWSEEKESLKKVQARLTEELTSLQKEYHSILETSCKSTGLTSD
ncbi:YEATS domain-containing protein [Entamoeba marina]